MRAPDRLILMGVFGAPQGVRGEVRVKSLTGDPKAIGGYGPLTNKGQTLAFASNPSARSRTTCWPRGSSAFPPATPLRP